MQSKIKKILFIALIIILLAVCAVFVYLIFKAETNPEQQPPNEQPAASQEKDYTKEDVEEALREPMAETDRDSRDQQPTPEQKSETQKQVEDVLSQPAPEPTQPKDYTKEDVQSLLSK